MFFFRVFMDFFMGLIIFSSNLPSPSSFPASNTSLQYQQPFPVNTAAEQIREIGKLMEDLHHPLLFLKDNAPVWCLALQQNTSCGLPFNPTTHTPYGETFLSSPSSPHLFYPSSQLQESLSQTPGRQVDVCRSLPFFLFL